MNEPDAFLDTNVMLRYLLNDHQDQSPRAKELFEALARGDRTVRMAESVVLETVFVLAKTYRIPRNSIRDELQLVIDLPGIVMPGKSIFRRVFELYTMKAGLSFADCYHVALTEHLGLTTIISFDRKLGSVPGISREEP